jgi:hypothetical protein
MAVVQKTVDVAKEADDVFMLLLSVLKDVKAGVPVAEIATGNLAKLMTAVEGFSELDDEAKNDRKALLVGSGIFLGEVTDTLLG